MRTVLASTNAGKAREFDRLLRPRLEIVPLPEGIALPEETGHTFAENARLKAESVAARLGHHVAVLADDSGLEVAALGNEPGVRSARYAGETATDEQNVEKLLHQLESVERRGARFVCALCMVVPSESFGRGGRTLVEVEGRLEGEITVEPRGDRGFGYDPVFQPRGWDATLAQADPAAKDEVSHRGAAARELLRRLGATLPEPTESRDGHGA